MEPGISSQDVVNTQAKAYRDKAHKGKIALVLGAGNASSLPAADFLYKLFIEDQVVILKMNPINAYLSPFMEKAFGVLIQRGVLRLIQGGSTEGTYVCHHPAVDEIHLTGSDKTFEAILFGPGSEGAQRKAERNPVLNKRVTAELGNVSPVIIVPGPWSHEEIKEQAVQLATMLVAGAGCFCMTPRVIVQHKSWSQRETFLNVIGEVLSHVQTHKAYYPNAKARHAAFVTTHSNARRFGETSDVYLPWTLIPDVDPDKSDDICFKNEAFCSLFAETALEAPSVTEFIDRAVQFVNETLWGTLAATIIVHPKSLENPQTSLSVDQAIANLRYGTIAVNLFAAYGHYFMVTPWGGYPGQDMYDVQSGVGWTNNVLMFQRPQKSVYRAPFRKIMDPLTVTARRPHEFGKKLAYLDAFPSVGKLSSIMWTALRS
jgi:acyl-CoA reductase-like NAD-dependent aldehyde dehydrogenase